VKTLKRLLYKASILIVLFIICMGALSIYNHERMRKVAEEEAQQKLKEWHLQIASELSSDQQDEWRDTSAEVPDSLLRTCVQELEE
jgi:hypothetical protein